MKIRRFYSHNMRTALKQVAETFGEDAAILSNKKIEGGVEVIAALDYDESLIPEFTASPHSAIEDAFEQSEHQSAATNNQSSVAQVEMQSNALQSTNSSLQANSSIEKSTIVEQMIKKDNHLPPLSSSSQSSKLAQVDNISAELKKPNRPSASKIEWTLDPSLQAMKEELELMRSMMSEQLTGLAWERFTEKSPLKAMIMRRLSQLGLDAQQVNHLLNRINEQQDIECSWQNMLAQLAKDLPIGNDPILSDPSEINPRRNQQCYIYALIGATGVGKTTTIAKLAARYVIKHGCDSIALISTDNYRITAQDQLATFGRILKIPTSSVNERNSLDSLLQKYADKQLILIDTPGLCQNSKDMLASLQQLNHCKRPIKKLLLMSATSQSAVLKQSVNLFSRHRPDGVVITKLDEATSLGEVLSVVMQANYPVFYTTDGQKIPEDIRVARSHHLVSKAVWLANQYASEPQEWGLAQTKAQQAKSA